MKTITCIVQIQADHPKGSRTKKAVALKLCDDINTILAQYDGVTGGAQIIPAPRNIKVTTTPDDWTNQTKHNSARQPGSIPGCRHLRTRQ